jgi:hypothetical protein
MGDGGGPARYTLLVPGIDWAYVGSIGGEGIEDFVATCLRQRFPDARQTRPASGDQGIDVVRETPDGIVVWQVKRFTAPLTPQQKQNVQRSWNRFWVTKVEPGVPIAAYYLATVGVAEHDEGRVRELPAQPGRTPGGRSTVVEHRDRQAVQVELERRRRASARDVQPVVVA